MSAECCLNLQFSKTFCGLPILGHTFDFTVTFGILVPNVQINSVSLSDRWCGMFSTSLPSQTSKSSLPRNYIRFISFLTTRLFPDAVPSALIKTLHTDTLWAYLTINYFSHWFFCPKMPFCNLVWFSVIGESLLILRWWVQTEGCLLWMCLMWATFFYHAILNI